MKILIIIICLIIIYLYNNYICENLDLGSFKSNIDKFVSKELPKLKFSPEENGIIKTNIYKCFYGNIDDNNKLLNFFNNFTE